MSIDWYDRCQAAEVELLLLRAEIERLTAENKDMKRTLSAPIPWMLERDLRDEIERLRADLRHLRKATIADRQDITRKDAETERLRNEVETWVAQAQRVAIENARLRAFVESVRNWDRFPLTELTDTDHERATAYRRQLEIHAAMARKALEGEK